MMFNGEEYFKVKKVCKGCEKDANFKEHNINRGLVKCVHCGKIQYRAKLKMVYL